MSDTRIQEVVGEALSAVSFVHDYLELHFDGKVIRAFSPPTVISSGRAFSSDASGWRDALCDLIGRKVREVAIQAAPDARLLLRFLEGAEIEVGLSISGRVGPEALHYVPGDNQPIEVW